MSKPATIVIAGTPREATQIEVAEATRPWTDFLLEDGTRLRVHIVIDAVHRLEGQFDARGNPMYYVNTRTVHSVTSPESMRRPPENAAG
jgi:hypothetical protein